MSNKINWSGKKIEKLIEYYRTHECLWNSNNARYMDADARKSALCAIAEALGLNSSSAGE